LKVFGCFKQDNVITGSAINYYFVCKRKLWFYLHKITMEHESELVQIGKILHENSYKRKRKEIELNGIKIDFFDKTRNIIHEVKKSKAIKESHVWQLKYYIYYFKKIGIEVTGEIDYPSLRKKEHIELSNEDEIELLKIIDEINALNYEKNVPLKEKKKICKNCSYYELCFI